MTAPFKRIIIVAIALILVAALACAIVLSGGCSPNAASPIEGAKNGAVNTILDVSGIKSRVDAQVRAKASEAADEYGISQTVVNNVIDSLAIEDWQATSLPPDADETGTYTFETDDTTAKVTTYDDPSIVTVEAYGQTITMELPESAQGYVKLLSYLDQLE